MNLKETHEKCPCCGRRPEFEIKALWWKVSEKEPPKDRPFVGKVRTEDLGYAVFGWLPSIKKYYTSSACYDYDEIEKWCDIPE